MRKEIACLAILWMHIVYSEAGKSDCPAIACTLDIKPPHCRTTTFFLHKDTACQDCDQCIEPSKHLDKKGCPLVACTRQMIPKPCRRERFFVYRGRTICQNCPEDICNK